MEREKKTLHIGARQRQLRGALLAIGSGGRSRRGESEGLDRRGSAAQIRAEPGTARSRGGGRGGSRAAPRRAGHARDRAYPNSPHSPRGRVRKKDPKLRGRARKARRGEARDARTRPARGEKRPSGVVGRCSRGARGSRRPRREPPRGFRRPHRVTSDRSDGREPPSGRARVRFPNRCAPWRRWCGARRARGRGGRGDRRRRWQTS